MTTAQDTTPEAGQAADAVGTRLDRSVGRPVLQALEWPRADPAALAAFDPSTKLCTMNCGQHRDDPRCSNERALLCDECWEVAP